MNKSGKTMRECKPRTNRTRKNKYKIRVDKTILIKLENTNESYKPRDKYLNKQKGTNSKTKQTKPKIKQRFYETNIVKTKTKNRHQNKTKANSA